MAAQQPNFSPSDLLEGFKKLLDSQLPAEYIALAENSQQQAMFFNNFVRAVTDKQDLSSFWDLPEKLGFSTAKAKQSAAFDWFSSFSDTSPSDTSDAFSETLLASFSQYQSQFVDYQHAVTAMNQIYLQISQLALEKFTQRQQSSSEADPQLYCQFWLEAGEESFKEFSNTKSFISTQQQLINALNSLKNQQQVVSQQFTGFLQLPSYQDIEELQLGLHEMRKNFAEYRESTEAEIALLKSRLKRKGQ